MAPADPTGSSRATAEISFVLPCLNEALTIAYCVQECITAIRASGVSGEVVVADNGSTDGSPEIAARAGARVIHVAARGYGSALISGIQAARGKYVLIGDSDMSYDFSQMPRFWEQLRHGADLVVGCRMPRGGGTIQPGAMPLTHRYLGNPLLSLLGRIIFHIDLVDFHCGIRAFERERILALGLQTSGMEFATEMIVKARLAGLGIKQVPVTLRPDGRNRPPHLQTWQDGWRHLRFMLLHAPRWLFLYPGFALTAFSLGTFILLLSGPVVITKIRFDVNTLLVMAAGILAGFQVMVLGLFSEIFSRRFGLLPPSKLTERILGIGLFEKGIAIGGGILVAGFLYLIFARLKWKSTGFGNLSYPDTLRLTIPAVVGMCLGVQIMFGGFLLAVLGQVPGIADNNPVHPSRSTNEPQKPNPETPDHANF